MAWIAVVFNLSDIDGPAVLAKDGAELTNKLKVTIGVTAAWMIMYYNYVGIQVLTIFATGPLEIHSSEDVTDKYSSNAARFAGNMFEQSVVFLPGLWLYSMFCDSGTGGWLGVLYIIARGIYPFYYMAHGRFTFWFENCTQIGYGVVGTYFLGALFIACGGNWSEWSGDNKILAPILGFLAGSFAVLPGIPLTIPYTYAHYKFENARKRKQIEEENEYAGEETLPLNVNAGK